MPPESSQNRTNGRGAALKETVRLVYMVACGGNPRRLGALPNTVLHLDRGEPQAAKAVLAGLPEDSPLLVQYKQFCSEKYKGKSGDFKATTLARTAFKAAKKVRHESLFAITVLPGAQVQTAIALIAMLLGLKVAAALSRTISYCSCSRSKCALQCVLVCSQAVDAHDKRVQQGAAGHGGDQVGREYCSKG